MNNKDQLRQLARSLGVEANDALFRLADVLLLIHRNNFHYSWGWKSWTEYVENEVGVHVGASYELLLIARWANRYNLTNKQRKQLSTLGRCKVAVLTKLARKDNVEEWLEYAEVHTIRKLRAMAKGIPDSRAPKTVAVWLHAEHRRDYQEALKLAQNKLGADVIQSELIGEICAFYIKHKRVQKRRKSA